MKEKWRAFCRWRGWKTCGAFFVKLWKKLCAWPGWRKLFCIHPVLLVLLILGCTAGLVSVFSNGWDMTALAFVLYGVSAYTLVAACVKIPGAYRGIKNWIVRHPKLDSYLHNRELKFKVKLYREQAINFGYGLYKIISGVVYGSAWIGADGIYNMMQGIIQLFQILRRRKHLPVQEQWKSYRMSGVLILLLHLTMIGLVFQMVNLQRAAEYPQILVIATAAFTFYKIISAVARVAKDRKHEQPMDSSIRMLRLSQAFFSMYSLQVSMIHAFGTGEAWEFWMNAASGCVVCLLVVSLGFYMIWRANRDMKKCQEINNEK